eukprot:m.116637 g.116637  ORF g.116637 m.116637 type:complete len:88 (+) comp12860_c1_seq1:2249-2512(+)
MNSTATLSSGSKAQVVPSNVIKKSVHPTPSSGLRHNAVASAITTVRNNTQQNKMKNGKKKPGALTFSQMAVMAGEKSEYVLRNETLG